MAHFVWPLENIFSSNLPAIHNEYYANVRDNVNSNWASLPAVIAAYNSPENSRYIFAHSNDQQQQQQRAGLTLSVLNAPLPFYDDTTVDRIIQDLRAKITYASSIAISFGFMHSAQLVSMAKFKYASTNTQLLDEYITVLDRHQDLERLRPLLAPQKVFEKLEHDFVKSYRIQIIDMFQVMVQVWYTQNPVGCVASATMQRLLRNKKHSVVTFAHDAADNLCFFRCLVYHATGKTECVTTLAKQLHTRAVAAGLMRANEQLDVARNTAAIEAEFQVKLMFYDEHGELYPWVTASNAYMHNKLSILLVDSHCVVIKNLYAFYGKHACTACNKFFGKRQTLETHQCRAKKQHTSITKFKGGVEQPEPTMFDYLDAIGCHVPEELRYNRGFVAFDVECMLQPPDAGTFESRTLPSIVEEHVPCSIAMAYSGDADSVSNPHYIVLNEHGPEELVLHFVVELEQMYLKHMLMQRERYMPLLDAFEACVERVQPPQVEQAQPRSFEHKVLQICAMKQFGKMSPLERLRCRLYSFVFKLSVIGYNSSSYDLNVLREWLFPVLGELGKVVLGASSSLNDISVLKRRNRYLCVETPHFKFIDAYLYVAAGTSLKGFMKSQLSRTQAQTLGKLEFPYRYLTTLDVLADTALPPVEPYWLPEERMYYAETDAQRRQTMLEEATVRRANAQAYWDEHGLHTFGDYLRAYNAADVTPFIIAFQNFAALFEQSGFDVFRYITLPALAKDYGVRSSAPGNYFVRFTKHDEEVYNKIRNNIFGGVSMVWNRYVECGKTTIRPWEVQQPHTVQSIVGVDMSGCYLQASSEEHMTGPFFERPAPRFAIGHNRFRDLNASLAIETLAHELFGDIGLAALQHKWKGGEKRFLTERGTCYSVDGYMELPDGRKIGLEFNGCYYHNHSPCPMRKKPNPKHDADREAIRANELLNHHVDELCIMWECEWLQRRDEPAVQAFLATRPLYTTYATQNGMSEDDIKARIVGDQIKGFFEIDAYVPHAKRHLFRDVNPFFYRMDVHWDMIGSTMQQHLRTQNRQFEQRPMLLNPPYCEKLLLPHQYVKYLLQLGIVITKIHSVLEFPYASRPFQQLAAEISRKRQAAASDPAKEAEGLIQKLIGNALYGTFITNPYDFTNTRFVTRVQAERALFQKPIRALTQLSENMYELTTRQRTITIKQPVQFAKAVYDLSKLRVLMYELEWFSMMEYEKYALVLSDTDSVYMCFAHATWEQCCRPDVTTVQLEAFKRKWYALHENQSKQAGLWHEEFNGTLVIALAPKLYIAVCRDAGKIKLATRGISTRHNTLGVTEFWNKLHSNELVPSPTPNRHEVRMQSFRMCNDRMVTYQFYPQSFTACYIKRRVRPDLHNTRPLRWKRPAWVVWPTDSDSE